MVRQARQRGRPVGTRGEKRREAELRRDRAIEAAAHDFRHGMPARQAGALHGVSGKTVWARAHGRPSRRDSHEHQQALTHAEEAQLISDLEHIHQLHHAVTHDLVLRRAESIRARRGETKPLSRLWDRLRVERENDAEGLAEFYDNVRKSFVSLLSVFSPVFQLEYAYSVAFPDGEPVDPKRVWNMDEKGFLIGVAYRQHIIVFRRRAEGSPSGDPTVTQDGSREFVTSIDAINAEGDCTPPFLILKGQQVNFGWIKNSRLGRDAHLAASESGWTTNVITHQWLRQSLIPTSTP
uniref:DDE-1 domain-containing protein n=1 Tax=Mycena chlorophos TaxID=658473 RepID=A0ABQ0LEF0_MYCCL|nr:predicted protein [Mycena chlorophos]